MRPVVLVTADRRSPSGFKPSPRVRPYRPEVFLTEAYVEAVWRSGGEPLIVPPGEPTAVEGLLRIADAVVLTGGDFDIHPSFYGEEVVGRLDRVEPGRTHRELALAQFCLERSVPVLGICGGMQALAVAAGGKLIQDLPEESPEHLAHEQPSDPAVASHEVRIWGRAASWLGERVQVNSTHHQAVRDPGRGFSVCGTASDGVVEVIAADTGFALGVQWHPELLGDDRVYAALVAEALQRRQGLA
jgi:putative glutamine amidotransferase